MRNVLEKGCNLAIVDADIYLENLGAGKDIEVSDRKRQGKEKKRLISTTRTWHALYSTTVKWSSTAPRAAVELIVNVGHTGRGEKTIQAKNKANKGILVAPQSPQRTLGTLFGLGLVDEGLGLLPAVVIFVFVSIAR